MTITKYLFSLAALAVLVGGFGSVASANHSWDGPYGTYHWARTTPIFSLQLGDNVSSTWDNYLTTASNDWSISDILDTQVVAGKGGKNCKTTLGRAEICNAKYGRNGWLGIAQIWASREHIVQGLVKMNDTYFNSATYNKPEWRAMVVCQEIGHIFGLDHQDEAFANANMGTCMDYTNDPARDDLLGDNQHPNAHDYEELGIIYAHLDTTTTIINQSEDTTDGGNGPRNRGGQAAVSVGELGDDPTNWGREIRRSTDGRSSLFERDFGGEEKVITHVFWAEPREPAGLTFDILGNNPVLQNLGIGALFPF